MLSNKDDIIKYKNIIKRTLNELYNNDKELFVRNLCERCLVFRFAYYLQNELQKSKMEEYFVDCDYNSSFYKDNGKMKIRTGKPILNKKNKEIKKRFIDIIVHKRDHSSNLICFEIKKWNNRNSKNTEKDENNLKVLTSEYGYEYGFYLIFSRNKESVNIKIFKDGKLSGKYKPF